MVRAAATGCLLVLWLGCMCATQEEEPPLLLGLAQLRLQVAETEIVDELSTSGLAGEEKVTPTTGSVLVVVTLAGQIDEAWRLTITPDEFAAMYEVAEELPDGQERIIANVVRSCATAFAIDGRERWKIKPEKGQIVSTHQLREPGPVTVKAAFLLPDKVESFFVRIPTVAAGEAELPQR